MKRLLIIGLAWTAGALAADENFSKTVRPEDFFAAGLGKLSPEELARLDTLVGEFKSGALEAAKKEAAAAKAARESAEAKAVQAEAETKAVKAEAEAKAAKDAAKAASENRDDAGFFARTKMLLKPGTEVEYTTVESRIVGNFTGWEGRTVFKLENGQSWQVVNGGSYYTPAVANPKVRITPAAITGFWMTIEDVDVRVRVKLVSH